MDNGDVFTLTHRLADAFIYHSTLEQSVRILISMGRWHFESGKIHALFTISSQPEPCGLCIYSMAIFCAHTNLPDKNVPLLQD